MDLAIPSLADITQKMYNRVITETPLNAPLDSSITGTIIKICAATYSDLFQQLQNAYQQSNLSSATGTSLDQIGMVFGVPRRPAQAATTLGFTPAVRFTNNGNSSVTIPAGTRVWKGTNPQIAFTTINGALLSAGQSIQLHVQAVQIGEIYNVGVGEITNSNVPNANLTITNILPISNGSLQESDASYRSRILQECRRRKVLNVENLRSLVLSEPGVQDCIVLEQTRGSGSFDVVLIPYTYASLSQVISSCTTLVSQAVLAGTDYLVRGPNYRLLDVSIQLNFAASATNQDTVRESVRAQITSLINNLPIEDGSGIGTLYVGNIQAIAQVADPNVLTATASLGLDNIPIANTGTITLSIGDRIILRSLVVQ